MADELAELRLMTRGAKGAKVAATILKGGRHRGKALTTGQKNFLRIRIRKAKKPKK